MILVTGSEGVIGRQIRAYYPGLPPRRFDLKTGQDIRDRAQLRSAMKGVHGVVHCAAISRINTAEMYGANETNVVGTSNVVLAAQEVGAWVLNISSREVYGNCRRAVGVDAFRHPCSHYGFTKRHAEEIVDSSRQRGMRATNVRLSNVYGSPDDHESRVVPTFVKRAIAGEPLAVFGHCYFDFVHIADVVRGLLKVIDLLEQAAPGNIPPAVQLTTGISTTLSRLAFMVNDAAGTRSTIYHYEPRAFGARYFVGETSHAETTLGWRASVDLQTGIAAMVDNALAAERTDK